MAEETVVMATPVGIPGMRHVKGSVQWTARCGHRVWISPTTVNLMADPGTKVKIMCLGCIDPKTVAESEVRAVPGQMDEVEGELGAEQRQKLEAWLRGQGVTGLG